MSYIVDRTMQEDTDVKGQRADMCQLVIRIPGVHYDAVSARVKALAEGGSSTPLRLSDIDELGLRDALVAEMTKKQE